MNHLVIPLDRPHIDAVDLLVEHLATAAAVEAAARWAPHITLLAYEGRATTDVRDAVADAVRAIEPFHVRAHGYGLFTGPDASDRSLHVPVVRDATLDALHGRLHGALLEVGAEVASWTEPEWWTPHISILDRGLDARMLTSAVQLLASRRHPSWHIPVERVISTAGWDRGGLAGDAVLLRGQSRA